MTDLQPVVSLPEARKLEPDWNVVTVKPAFFVSCDGRSLPPEERIEWLRRNCEGRWLVSLDDGDFSGGHIRLHFERNDDAVLFVARWQGTQPFRFITYLCAQSDANGGSLDSERASVRQITGSEDVTEFGETLSRAGDGAPLLDDAIRRAESEDAVLVISSLAKLFTSQAALRKLQQASCRIIFADLPQISGADVRVAVLMSEWRFREASRRAKLGLARAKTRGKQIGGDRGNLPAVAEMGRIASAQRRRRTAQEAALAVEPFIQQAKAEGRFTLQGIADFLNERGIETPRGSRWTPTAVQRAKQHLSAARRGDR